MKRSSNSVSKTVACDSRGDSGSKRYARYKSVIDCVCRRDRGWTAPSLCQKYRDSCQKYRRYSKISGAPVGGALRHDRATRSAELREHAAQGWQRTKNRAACAKVNATRRVGHAVARGSGSRACDTQPVYATRSNDTQPGDRVAPRGGMEERSGVRVALAGRTRPRTSGRSD